MNIKNILVAEDNPDEAFIFTMMFKKAALSHRLHMVEDGEEVIHWLEGRDGSPFMPSAIIRSGDLRSPDHWHREINGSITEQAVPATGSRDEIYCRIVTPLRLERP